MNKQLLTIYTFLIGLVLLASCSVERKNIISKAYHNTTAHYNGYFLAREKMRAVEEGLQQQMQYDYNQVLPIYPIIDSSTYKAFATDLEDIEKKASFPIQWHKNSKWIDDSYLIIGKTRYYQLNFADAARTFKYVNSISNDRHTKHEAMVWLMRSFIKMGEMDNAQAVSEHLRKERLNKDNARELYLARAHYHQLLGDTTAMMDNLALSLRNFTEKDDQSRARFSLARLYQFTDQDKEAYAQYNKILRRNPPYDLGFFSRLYLGQVTELTDAQDLERIAGYYKKMLKDDKNLEYRDKIYYEMAQFEIRQNNYDKALEYIQQSLKTPGALQNQKAYTYLLAGEMYFDKLNKYNLAAAYYDSAVQVFPQTAPGYEAVAEQRDILADFAQQYYTIQLQDSLQRLARMPEADRMALLNQLVQQEEEQRQQELARQQALQQTSERQQNNSGFRRNNQNNNNFAATTNASGVWYFDNPSAMASARAEFIRRWGNRPLQDFWRIQTRGQEEQAAEVVEAPSATTAPEESIEQRIATQVQQYLQSIPLTTAALLRSEKEEEEALFKLANIYAQHLNDPARAIATFEELLNQFPKSEHTPESYYSLYLLYGDENPAQQKAYYSKIKQQFPGTIYARLLDDSNYMSKNAADNAEAHALYAAAYAHYEEQEYGEATKLVNQLVSQYPLNDIKDKVAYLDVMITARTKKPQELQNQLQRFKAQYPNSPLQAQVDKLLASYTELEQKNLLRTDAPTAKAEKAKNAATLTPEQKVEAELATITASTARVSQPIQQKPQLPQEKAQPAKEEAPKPEATIASTTKGTEPEQQEQTPATAQPEHASEEAPVADNKAAPTREEALEYKAAPDSAFYFVLIYPNDAPAFKNVGSKYEQYNNTYNKKQNLEINSIAFSGTQTMLVIRNFTDPELAKSYYLKQKSPQAPVGRIRGVDFTTFVISSANYNKFMQKKDLEAYLTFFKNNY